MPLSLNRQCLKYIREPDTRSSIYDIDRTGWGQNNAIGSTKRLCGRYNIVGIVTHYGLGGPGFQRQ
jgi:hypothetical protein